MEEIITKEDLRQFGVLLLNSMQTMIQSINASPTDSLQAEWLKSKAVRKMLDISVGSVQNLRITKRIRFKKVMGSYYYNREDILKLFDDE